MKCHPPAVTRLRLRRSSKPADGAGFTLLEVILAVTIAGALLAAAAALMVSITDAWLQRQDRHFFEDHVDGVTEFLQASFSMAGSEIALEANNPNGSNPPPDPTPENADGADEASGGNNRNRGNNSQGNGNTGGALLRNVRSPSVGRVHPALRTFGIPCCTSASTRAPRSSSKPTMPRSLALKPICILKGTKVSPCFGLPACRKNLRISGTCVAPPSAISSPK
ncbi:MAG: prepilin-type N-terminal cleavage/methylation domain-containing protein [Puniceicoccaceae bacterium]|nr:MAG: prepilin-type N-terminal cleavage/methylation domain-containing protein [Puniceicoccaceae bacterium]